MTAPAPWEWRPVTFRKTCTCPAGTAAATGHLLTSAEILDGETVVHATLHPGPVCTGCWTPWAFVRQDPGTSILPGEAGD